MMVLTHSAQPSGNVPKRRMEYEERTDLCLPGLYGLAGGDGEFLGRRGCLGVSGEVTRRPLHNLGDFMKRLSRLGFSCGVVLLIGVSSGPGSLTRALSSRVSASRLATPNMAGSILTVKGPIDPDTLGPTIMHEHIFLDWRVPPQKTATDAGLYADPVTLQNLSILRVRATSSRDNLLLADMNLAIEELTDFKRWGGEALVDTTPGYGFGRDPRALVQVSNATGLDIVMGAGFYVDGFHPPDMDQRTVEDLAEELIRDVVLGVGDTGIRSGIIGEVGTSKILTANEIKSIRASARASRATGVAISFHHGGFWEDKFRVLDVIAAEGGDLNRVIIGHANHVAADVPFMKRLLERGVYIQFDLLGEVIPRLGRIHDADVVAAILKLVEAGYSNRLLLSQDVCSKTMLKAYGGMGYSYVLEFVVPELRRLGVTADQIEKIMVGNPRRVLTFAEPRPLP